MKREYTWKIKLGEILARKGMTQTELSQKTKIRQAEISELVNNKRNYLNKQHLSIIMDALNIVDLNDMIELRVIDENKGAESMEHTIKILKAQRDFFSKKIEKLEVEKEKVQTELNSYIGLEKEYTNAIKLLEGEQHD